MILDSYFSTTATISSCLKTNKNHHLKTENQNRTKLNKKGSFFLFCLQEIQCLTGGLLRKNQALSTLFLNVGKNDASIEKYAWSMLVQLILGQSMLQLILEKTTKPPKKPPSKSQYTKKMILFMVPVGFNGFTLLSRCLRRKRKA